jgi:hypothetical protein
MNDLTAVPLLGLASTASGAVAGQSGRHLPALLVLVIRSWVSPVRFPFPIDDRKLNRGALVPSLEGESPFVFER